MKFSILLLFSVLFAISSCQTTHKFYTNQGIIITNDENLDLARRAWNHLLVNFDAGCKWCLNFRPFYLAAYKEAKAQKYDATFAQLDLKKNPLTKAKYNIVNHPTQLFFVRFDSKSPYKYSGTKNKTKLLAWLKAKIAEVKKRGL